MAELAALTGLRPRTIRYDVDHGVLERPEFCGTPRAISSHLLRLLAIQRLRREGVPTLAATIQRIDAAGEAEPLRACVRDRRARGWRRRWGCRRRRPTAVRQGLELLVAEEASPAVRQVAEQIRGYCGRR